MRRIYVYSIWIPVDSGRNPPEFLEFRGIWPESVEEWKVLEMSIFGIKYNWFRIHIASSHQFLAFIWFPCATLASIHQQSIFVHLHMISELLSINCSLPLWFLPVNVVSIHQFVCQAVKLPITAVSFHQSCYLNAPSRSFMLLQVMTCIRYDFRHLDKSNSANVMFLCRLYLFFSPSSLF